MFAVDLHTHSRPFHGWRGRPTRVDAAGLHANRLAARARGLDAVATTNHDYAYSATLPEDGPVSIPGIEITTDLGHVLVVGPDPPARTTPRGLSPQEAVTLAHTHDCAAVLAHPYRNSAARDSGADFDAVEINGKNPEHVEETRELARALGLPLVGGSDAHYPTEVGRAYTRVEAAELTPASVVSAILDGRVTAVVHQNGLDRLVDRLYTAIHRAKGQVDGG